MALHVPKAPGFQSMMKDGSKFFSGVEEAVIRNIDACKEFSGTVATAFGPNGMNKMVINHLEKLFVTNDAATIIRELEVEHPAAKMMILGSQMMEQEVGDGTNFVIILAGALLKEAEDLVRMGLKPTEVAEGYELACRKALEFLENCACHEIKDAKNNEEVAKAVKTAVMSKQYGNEDFLADLIVRACTAIVPEKQTTFNVDNVRVAKILGSGLLASQVISGMVFKRSVESNINKAEKCKIAVYTCPIDSAQTETKGTVLIKSAQELTDFSKGEEDLLEKQIKEIVDAGVKVVVSGGKVGDLALHYLNKYGIMAVRLMSKWDVRRLCRAVNATPLPKLTPPTAEELGYADKVQVDELGDTAVVIFKMEATESKISTIVVRGATENYMDDIERAIDDGVNTYKGLCRDGRLVAGAGAVEMELAKEVASFGEKCEGLEQYAVQRFAQALHVVPKMLAENTGVKANVVIAELAAAHTEGKTYAGFDIESDSASTLKEDGTKHTINAVENQVFDLLVAKYWGLKYATDAAATILRVDQIIMAKRAGGPKAPKQGNGPMDDGEDY
jgi:T-complex protein 1 subunit theta